MESLRVFRRAQHLYSFHPVVIYRFVDILMQDSANILRRRGMNGGDTIDLVAPMRFAIIKQDIGQLQCLFPV